VLITLGLLAAATGIGLLFGAADMQDSNIIPLYLLVVLAISVLTSGPLYGLTASLLSVFVFNFFFTEPRYTLRVFDSAYLVTFLVMFFSSILTSSLTLRLKDYARHAAQGSYQTKVLLDTSQLLQQVSGKEAIAGVTANQIAKLSEKSVVVYLAEEGKLMKPQSYPGDTKPDPRCFSEIDQEAAQWAFVNRRRAGAGTTAYPSARMLYLSIRIRDHAYGVIGIDESESQMDTFLLSLLLSIMDECAMAMENEKNVQEKEKTEEDARSQKLRADLLRSISHDLRTPLTSIYGNASVLQQSASSLSPQEKQQMYDDISSDSMWLIEVVQNLLSITRLEGGEMSLHKQAELMDEVIDEALKHIDHAAKKHHITTEYGDDILLARMDARLMMEVIVNLVNNAVKYTQEGSEIHIHAWKESGQIHVSVSDNGPGMSDEQKRHAFEMFYTGPNDRIADARRSLGIGLSLCQSILHAHHGEISVKDSQPHGTVFTFTLPAEEVKIHEQ
jgi:two-component system sensor histidine kinase KdpD